MGPFDDLILNDINEEIMTDLEIESLHDEYLYEDADEFDDIM